MTSTAFNWPTSHSCGLSAALHHQSGQQAVIRHPSASNLNQCRALLPYKHQRQLRPHLLCCAGKAAVGIDLGTTNSVVAVLREGETLPTVIHDRSSSTFTVPSVVAYNTETGHATVGTTAKRQASSNPSNTFYSVKRLIGRQWEDVQELSLVYKVAAGQDGGLQLECPALSHPLTPQQVSAELLKHLLQLASQHLDGQTPQQVVITVPAYFSTAQRAATLESAKLAGIQQVSLLQEPVAAALAFGFGKPYDAETLLVFDLGGGTFDLSVVDSFEGIMEVLATGGNPLLGGDDFDQLLLNWLLQQMSNPEAAAAQSGSNGSSSSGSSSNQGLLGSLQPEALSQLLEAVEVAKCQLSCQESAQIPISSEVAASLASAVQQQDVVLTKQQMHAVTAPLRQQLWQPLQPLAESCKLEYACPPSSIEQQLQAAALKPAQQTHAAADASSNGSSHSSSAAATGELDPYAPKPRKLTAVLLVGGATRMPIIQQGLKVLTGLNPRNEVDPEQAVAIGAAIQAAVLLGLSSGVELMDGSYVEELHQRSTGF